MGLCLAGGHPQQLYYLWLQASQQLMLPVQLYCWLLLCEVFVLLNWLAAEWLQAPGPGQLQMQGFEPQSQQGWQLHLCLLLQLLLVVCFLLLLQTLLLPARPALPLLQMALHLVLQLWQELQMCSLRRE